MLSDFRWFEKGCLLEKSLKIFDKSNILFASRKRSRLLKKFQNVGLVEGYPTLFLH